MKDSQFNDNARPRRILLTGGAGFIGSHLIQELGEGFELVVIDNFSTGKRENVPSGIPILGGSILNKLLVEEAMRGVDSVIHLAADSSVTRSYRQPEQNLGVNLLGTMNLLKAAAKHEVRNFVFASSAAVYGNSQKLRQTEDLDLDPISPYGMAKLTGEQLCRLHSEISGFRFFNLRLFNVFGERQDDSAPTPVVLSFFKAALAGEPLPIFGDGDQTRDFVYAGDVAHAIRHLLESPAASQTLNVGYSRGTSIRELAQRVIAVTNSESTIEFHSSRVGDIQFSTSCNDRLLAAGFQPKFGFKLGLERTHDWVSSLCEKQLASERAWLPYVAPVAR